MTAPNKSQGGDSFLPESRDHRYGDRLRFIARFPAYTTVEQPQGLTCWPDPWVMRQYGKGWFQKRRS